MIVHIDGDAFFASCETARDISLRGKKVVVGEEKGIATAVSYEAKKAGVSRGMPVFEIRRSHKDVIVLPSDFDLYSRFSRRMMSIASRYMPYIEEYSVDECFCRSDEPVDIVIQKAKAMQADISKKLGITVSVGVSYTKVLAKIASKRNKPHGFTALIDMASIMEYLKSVPIGGVWGIGGETSVALKRYGVTTAYDFAMWTRDRVSSNLSKPYLEIWHELRGESVMSITTASNIEKRKSVQDTESFPSTSKEAFLKAELSRHVESATATLRSDKLVASRLSFFLKTKGNEYFRYELTLPIPTSNPSVILKYVYQYFDKVYLKGAIYKTSGVTLSGLWPSNLGVSDLFGESESLNDVSLVSEKVDEIRRKIGDHVIGLASTLGSKAGDSVEKRDRESMPLIYLGEY